MQSIQQLLCRTLLLLTPSLFQRGCADITIDGDLTAIMLISGDTDITCGLSLGDRSGQPVAAFSAYAPGHDGATHP